MSPVSMSPVSMNPGPLRRPELLSTSEVLSAPPPPNTLRRSAWRPTDDDLFGHQPTSSRALPDPAPLLENLARIVIEVLAGARDLEQIGRWVTEDVYQHLLRRVSLAARTRRLKGQVPVRPSFTIGAVHGCEPRDGVVESTVVVHARARSRAVAIRLEGLDRRWRATAIHVL
ncbi:MAG: Rv3235 family protein [Microbacterium sp.]|nr:Rv3235 family protein [Microbacterium sp.]